MGDDFGLKYPLFCGGFEGVFARSEVTSLAAWASTASLDQLRLATSLKMASIFTDRHMPG